ncbi:MAG: AmmeMemoRadiSam system protein A [Candidatus Woesearchaeota archaeon]
MHNQDKKLLLELARKSIETVFTKKQLDLDKYEHINQKSGCFVTLKLYNNLRGCIGYVEPIYPLYRLIANAAVNAAFRDPRFPELKHEELEKIKIEISVLTKPEQISVNNPIEYLKKISIGKDGLIIKGIYGSGLLLPQVATEYNMDVKEFLECLSQKAGLDKNAWMNPKNKIFKFRAEIFSEDY